MRTTKEKCSKCGSESFAVARDMIGTRHCGCGHTWVPVPKQESLTIEEKLQEAVFVIEWYAQRDYLVADTASPAKQFLKKIEDKK